MSEEVIYKFYDLESLTQEKLNKLARERNTLAEENKQLKEEIEEQKKYNTELMLCNSGFNAILTELEEWLNRDDLSYVETQLVLDKIQELKEKYK